MVVNVFLASRVGTDVRETGKGLGAGPGLNICTHRSMHGWGRGPPTSTAGLRIRHAFEFTAALNPFQGRGGSRDKKLRCAQAAATQAVYHATGCGEPPSHQHKPQGDTFTGLLVRDSLPCRLYTSVADDAINALVPCMVANCVSSEMPCFVFKV